jgi:hypothetical protein
VFDACNWNTNKYFSITGDIPEGHYMEGYEIKVEWTSDHDLRYRSLGSRTLGSVTLLNDDAEVETENWSDFVMEEGNLQDQGECCFRNVWFKLRHQPEYNTSQDLSSMCNDELHSIDSNDLSVVSKGLLEYIDCLGDTYPVFYFLICLCHLLALST